MDARIEAFLENLGLARNEIKIYMAALELGEASASDIAARAHVHRVAAYAVISSLINKGFLIQTSVRHGRRISAQHPKNIESLLRSKRRQLRRLGDKYQEVLPELTTLYQRSGTRPRVQFYEGWSGLEQINADIINSLKELTAEQRVTHSYSNPMDIADRFDDYLIEEGGYIDSRKKFGIHNIAIALDGPVTQEIALRNEEELREMVALPAELFPFKNDITIYANKVAIMALQKEIVGVIIESKEIADDQRAIFRIAWEGAKVLAAKL